MSAKRLSALRVVLILTRMRWRRALNRITVRKRRKTGVRKDTPARTATPGKKLRSNLLTVVLGILMSFGSFSMSGQFLARLAEECERLDRGDGRLFVSFELWSRLITLDAADSPEARERARADLERSMGFEHVLPADSDGERQEKSAEVLRVFEERGLEGFKTARPGRFLDARRLNGEARGDLLRSVGLFLLVLWIALLLMSLGSAHQDLGKVEWSFEWLFTFPVPTTGLFLAKILEEVFANILGWIVVLPFSLALFWSLNEEIGPTLFAALSATVYLLALQGTALVVGETWLRKRLALGRLKNLQALFTLTGMALWFAVLGVAVSETLPELFVNVAVSVPRYALFNPLSLPVAACLEGTRGVLGALALLPVGACAVWLGVTCGRWLVRDGLLVSPGVYQGTRRAMRERSETGEAVGRGGFLRGIAGKEFRLLSRDRSFLTQTLVVPLLIIGLQLIINPAILRGAAADARHASVLAFGIGAYVLAFSGFQVLATEGKSLWLLYTLPRSIDHLLFQKTKLWCVCALAYTLAILVAVAVVSAGLSWPLVVNGVVAVVGVVLYSFISSAMGTMGSDPLEVEVRRRIDPTMMQVYLLLAGLFAFAIYSPSIWQKVAQCILSAVLAAALWQKARDRLPFLLDPTAAPPPRISLSDGLISVLTFFVLQGVLFLGIVYSGLVPPGPGLVLSFSGAGLLVTVLSLYIFWRAKVRDVPRAIGLGPGDENTPASLVRGLVAGGGAALFAWIYLEVITRVEMLSALREDADRLSIGLGSSFWLALAGIIAAPLFEEYIFRGLVYRGLRRSYGPLVSVLGSAALFAIVHPPASVIPVFVLGLAAGWSFERSGRLVTPIAAHLAYNAAVFWLQSS